MRANPAVAETQAARTYAWDENTEGGWVVPTKGHGTMRVDAFAKAWAGLGDGLPRLVGVRRARVVSPAIALGLSNSRRPLHRLGRSVKSYRSCARGCAPPW